MAYGITARRPAGLWRQPGCPPPRRKSLGMAPAASGETRPQRHLLLGGWGCSWPAVFYPLPGLNASVSTILEGCSAKHAYTLDPRITLPGIHSAEILAVVSKDASTGTITAAQFVAVCPLTETW